ncbi:thap-type zinc finger [Holotrichia oblita]|uniref:Thap-type zinc finger n=1 Tax=Holotrichia oblita TaxID=644536 RepID=A0ACB9SH96_HOLOL|nr:thap-type zinc finger [Holotrichia oblita]
MERYRACSVKNCKDKTSTRHTFPNPTEDPERFSKWLEACRNSDLFNMHPHQVFSSRKVCDIHFPPAMKKSLKQLTTEAVPEQCLPQQLNIEGPEGSHSRSLPVSIPDQIEVSAEPMPVAPLRNVDIQTLEDHYEVASQVQVTSADDFIFNNLKKNELPEREKYCIIMFDEMSIQPNILFNTQTGQFEGFEDMGDRKSQHIANHVQVFMLKSVAGTTAADGSSLDKNAEGTAILLKFFDSLFDSFNGSQKLCTNKPLKSYIKVGSPHFEFWSEAKKILSSMYFIDDKNRRHVPPSIKNWIITINGLIAVVKGLPEGITFLKGRSFNQDPLENFLVK